jgi:hypothetical protein
LRKSVKEENVEKQPVVTPNPATPPRHLFQLFPWHLPRIFLLGSTAQAHAKNRLLFSRLLALLRVWLACEDSTKPHILHPELDRILAAIWVDGALGRRILASVDDDRAVGRHLVDHADRFTSLLIGEDGVTARNGDRKERALVLRKYLVEL